MGVESRVLRGKVLSVSEGGIVVFYSRTELFVSYSFCLLYFRKYFLEIRKGFFEFVSSGRSTDSVLIDLTRGLREVIKATRLGWELGGE